MSRRTNPSPTPISGATDAALPNGAHSYRPVVLVVDDECSIAETLSEILIRTGFNASTAYDGASALEAALLNPPEVLITDVILPGMSGIELAISLRRIFPDCKVILFSGNAATTSMLASATRAGHNFTLLTKPVHPDVMLRHVSECVRSDASIRQRVHSRSHAGVAN